MNFNNLTSINESKKLAAMLVFFLCVILFIIQCIHIFFPSKSEEKVIPVLDNKAKQLVLDANSPLFNTALFGDYVPDLSDANIKKSNLDLKVVGIMFSSKKGSQVLISAGSDIEEAYSVGDKLPGGAVIKRITEDNVVILYNGELESLSLPENELLFEEAPKPLFEE